MDPDERTALRDSFARAALTGLLLRPSADPRNPPDADALAARAYELAAAMLDARP